MDSFSRVKGLIGEKAFNKLKSSHVAVFGCGGVGGACIESLVRSGVGEITVIDNDVVSESNINRQIIATEQTVGEKKVSAWERRLKAINSQIKVNAVDLFYLPENSAKINLKAFDFVVDAIDTVSAKLHLIESCFNLGVPIISSMGTAGKLDATKLQITDIYKTSGCPLARVMRKELKVRQIPSLKVVYSTEPVINSIATDEVENKGGKNVPCSMTFVPSCAGIIIAGEVVKYLTQGE